MVNGTHNIAHPVIRGINDAGRVVQQVVFREQVVDVVNAVAQCINLAVLDAGICKGSLHGAAGLCALNHIVDLIQAVLQHGAILLVFKAVVHSFFLLTIVVIVTLTVLAVIQGRTDDCVNHVLLFLRQGIKYLFDGLLVGVSHLGFSFLFLITFAGIIRVLQILVLQQVIVRVQPMLQAQTRIGINEGFGTVLFGAIRAVLHDLINQSTGVTSDDNQTQFFDHTMHHSLSGFLDAVGIDRHCVNVAIVHASLGSLSTGTVVHLHIGIHTIFPVLQQCVTQHIVRAGMIMVPHDRNHLTITFLEGIRCNSQAIKALHIGFSCPTGKVIIEIDCHFEFFALLPADLH